jgi:hypothetical protein
MSAHDPVTEAAYAVDGVRRLWLELTRVAISGRSGGEPDAVVAAMHEWLQDLPLTTRPALRLSTTVQLEAPDVRWEAAGAPSAMTAATIGHLHRLGATDDELELVGRIGAAADPGLLGTWIERRHGALGAGWTMSHGLEGVAALDAVDDTDQRAILRRALDRLELVSIGRSIGSATTRVLLRAGASSDDDAVLAVTDVLAALAAPRFDDAGFGAILHEAGDRSLGLSVWTLDDGLARVALVVEEPSTSLLVHLAMLGGWPEGATRAAALLGTADVEHPSRLEWSIDADGPGLAVTVEIADRMPQLH